ncbi:hypothetical protein Tco_1050126, partial [Tanacetum coccineum]
TWILEAYKERALNYYRHVDRHPRAVAWFNVNQFYRVYLEKFFEGAGPIGRLRLDSFEAKAEWWVSSRAFLDGRICKPPQIPPAVRNDIYQRVDEQDRPIKELKQQNVDQYKILNSINKHFEASSSFFEGAQMTPTYPGTSHIGTLMAQPRFASCFSRYHPSHLDTPHIRTPMAQPGFASCSSWYPPSHPGTSYIGTSLALQGFAPWSSNYQAGPSHNHDVVRVNPVTQ